MEDDEDLSNVENSDFTDTSIPSPYGQKLPKVAYVDEEVSEEVREKVLAWAIDDSCDSDVGKSRLNSILSWGEGVNKRFRRCLDKWLTEATQGSPRREWDDMVEIKQIGRID